ncbi:IS66 family transposase [Belnapia sp. F-4-1]|uniref:IS66 family transposase n=1 Tax=Belnapia sp. F-4-1 TaxID=1545443 RepID=UPI00068AEA26|nr:IS66 family transposase [Belnapia sp. F-4-1]
MPSCPGRPSCGGGESSLVRRLPARSAHLYRQSEIYARDGVDLQRSTLADWVGQSAALLRPLLDVLAQHVLAGAVLHADDTPVPVLAPGLGRTSTGRLWVYLRDERPHGSTIPPAVLYRYSPDRRAEHTKAHLAGFRGVLQADGYGGFESLYEGGRVIEAACWTHVRRPFYDLHLTGQAPLATKALRRIALLYAVEEEIRGKPPDERAHVRQARAGPMLEEMYVWLRATLGQISGKSDLAGAIRYALIRWEALTRYLADGRLEPDTDVFDKSFRAVPLSLALALG